MSSLNLCSLIGKLFLHQKKMPWRLSERKVIYPQYHTVLTIKVWSEKPHDAVDMAQLVWSSQYA